MKKYKKIVKDLSSSDEKFKLFIEKIPVGFFVHDGDSFTYVNPVFEKLSGYKSSEIVRKKFWSIIYPEDRELVKQRGKERLVNIKNPPPTHYTFRMLTKSNEIKWVDLRMIIMDYKGQNVALGMFDDITEQKVTEDRLKESENKFRNLFFLSPNILGISTLKDGKYIDVNDNFVKLLGWKKTEIIGHTSKEMNIFVDYSLRSKIISEVIKKGKIESLICPVRTKSGKILITNFSTEIVELSGEKCLLTQVVDITNHVETEKKLEESNNRLSEIIDFLPDPTFVIDQDKKIIAWNRAIVEMTGISKNKIIGKDHSYAAIPFYGKRRLFLLDLLYKTDEELSKGYKFVTKKGEYLYAETNTPSLYNKKGAYVWATAGVIKNKENKVVGAIESIRDITDRKLKEKELNENNIKLSRINKAMIGRELKMIQLKKELERCKQEKNKK